MEKPYVRRNGKSRSKTISKINKKNTLGLKGLSPEKVGKWLS
jgi:hypothetical protein